MTTKANKSYAQKYFAYENRKTENNLTAASHSSKYQDFLKSMAILSMIIDHIGCFFFPQIITLRALGRVSSFLFLFIAGYNYTYGKHFKKDHIYLGFSLAANSILFGWYLPLNILITIWIGYIFLEKIVTKDRYMIFAYLLLMLAFSPISDIFIEYGTAGIFIMTCGYYYKLFQNNELYKKFILLTALYVLWEFNIHILKFNIDHIALISASYIAVYFLIIRRDLMSPIVYNLRLVTQYSSMIYFVHLSVFMIIFLVIN